MAHLAISYGLMMHRTNVRNGRFLMRRRALPSLIISGMATITLDSAHYSISVASTSEALAQDGAVLNADARRAFSSDRYSLEPA